MTRITLCLQAGSVRVTGPRGMMLPMAYTSEAAKLRRCTATRADGQPCRAWAAWDDAQQRCNVHAGRHFRGPATTSPWWRAMLAGNLGLAGRLERGYRTRAVACRCEVYPWPHRPGGGDCRWPQQPGGEVEPRELTVPERGSGCPTGRNKPGF